MKAALALSRKNSFLHNTQHVTWSKRKQSDFRKKFYFHNLSLETIVLVRHKNSEFSNVSFGVIQSECHLQQNVFSPTIQTRERQGIGTSKQEKQRCTSNTLDEEVGGGKITVKLSKEREKKILLPHPDRRNTKQLVSTVCQCAEQRPKQLLSQLTPVK